MSLQRKDLIKNDSVCLDTLKRAIAYIEATPAVADYYDEFYLSFLMEVYSKVKEVEDVEVELEEMLHEVLREEKNEAVR